MKKLIVLFSVLVLSCKKETTTIPTVVDTPQAEIEISSSKKCTTTNKGLVPINDLGSGIYKGFMGGLYPNGSNTRPPTHLTAAMLQGNEIKLLAFNGTTDEKNGKIVMIGVGASNPRAEFEAFITKTKSLSNLNPNLKIINTCIGGQGVQKMNQVAANYWVQASKTLQSASLSDLQVQIAWIETENTQDAEVEFPKAPQKLMTDLQILLQTLKKKFPNLKICYLSGRSYSGYAEAAAGEIGKGLLYPRDYYNGWAMKWIVEKQINNEAGFQYSGLSSTIPFVTMGSYHWTDADKTRLDGFGINCATDIGDDGLHLTTMGEQKIAGLIFTFFNTDVTAKSWFLK